ncbi:MAG: methylmalonyl-CoA mutase family protein [Nocardioides sp.]
MSDEVTADVAGGLDEPDRLQPEPGSLALAAPEDDWSRADWEKAAAGVLRKARRLSDSDDDDQVWAALTRTTYDGVPVPPLGTRDPGRHGASPRPDRVDGWDVRVRAFDGTDAVAELERGATSLWVLAEHVPADTLASYLDGVLLDLAPVVLEGATAAHAEALVALGPLHPESNLGAAVDAEDLAAFARLALAAGTRAAVVDGLAVHERGASDAQELGWVLARGAGALRSLEVAGIPIEQAFGLLELRVAVTDEQFPSIAKLRALRVLWARVAELCGVADPLTRVHAVTSRPMTSAYDVHVNLLRTTLAAFAAGVGGADAVTVVPFDEPTGDVSPLGRRLARNISALLVEESHVARVADPAGGSYAVEQLTDELCGAAWAELGLIETDGEESFRDRVAQVRAAREDDVAHRRRPITGLSEFANPADPPPGRRNLSYRWGAAFEALRADPPEGHVFLAPLGPVAEHSARAGFATNLLAAGGVAVDASGEYAGQRVVCLAGTDAAYAELGDAEATRLRAAGAERVVVAGRPADWADDSCAVGDDVVAFLTRTREAL